MRWTLGIWMTAAVAVGLVCAAPARAGWIVVPPRPGQVGLSLSGSYGALMKAGDLGAGFSSGSGLAFRLRYRMRYERAFGLSFEQHGLDVRPGVRFRDADGVAIPEGSEFTPRKLNLYLYGLDFYQLFGTRTKSTRMLDVGAGIAHPARELVDGETDYPGGDGFFVSAGAGVERFIWQSWGLELSGRYHAIFHEGRTNHDFQAYAGVLFYASL